MWVPPLLRMYATIFIISLIQGLALLSYFGSYWAQNQPLTDDYAKECQMLQYVKKRKTCEMASHYSSVGSH